MYNKRNFLFSFLSGIPTIKTPPKWSIVLLKVLVGLALEELRFYHWVHYRKHPGSAQSAQISGPENGCVNGISQTNAMEMVPTLEASE